MKSLDQRAHEARGLCWHETMAKIYQDQKYLCLICKEFFTGEDLPSYATNIADAWKLVEEMKKDKHNVEINDFLEGTWPDGNDAICTVFSKELVVCAVEAPTVPEAITRAFLDRGS